MTSLPFQSRPWHRDPTWNDAHVGTVCIQWRCTPEAYEILCIVNGEPGNGHFQQAMLWFEQSCIRNNRYLRIREVWNKTLAMKLVKHGFTYAQGDDMVKRFK